MGSLIPTGVHFNYDHVTKTGTITLTFESLSNIEVSVMNFIVRNIEAIENVVTVTVSKDTIIINIKL